MYLDIKNTLKNNRNYTTKIYIYKFFPIFVRLHFFSFCMSLRNNVFQFQLWIPEIN